MNPEISARKGQVVTALHLGGSWMRLVQVRLGESVERATLLAVKAKKVEGWTEDQTAAELKEWVRALPVRTEHVFGLVSTGEILTRYLRLPSADPEELKAMARYQMEGLLPFPAQECLIAVKVWGAVGEAVQVLAAAVHRPVLERFTRMCARAGLSLSGIAASAEAIGNWHQLCVPPAEGRGTTEVRLSAEAGPDGLDLEITSGGSLLYMRQVPVPVDMDQMAERIRETLRAYDREQIGPPVQRMILGGNLENLSSTPLERLETALELPVQRLEPRESGPLRESLRSVLQAVQPELIFSDLLGAALSPRLLELDLLPIENRLERARQGLSVTLQRTAALILLGTMALLVWGGVRVGTVEWTLRQTRSEIERVKPQAERAQTFWNSLRTVTRSRMDYLFRLQCVEAGLAQVPAGVKLQFLGLEPDQTLTVRGSAPDLEVLTRYAASLKENSLWEEVLLRSAKAEGKSGGSQVDFELFLRPIRGEKE